MTEVSPLSFSDLQDIAVRAAATPPCADCAPLLRPGWEALSTSADVDRLQRVGSLRPPDDGTADEPTLTEHHPAGTSYWSPDAPIAPRFFPANRCDVWVCSRCSRAFLRYTEYGGYYHEERIRPLRPEVLVDAAAG